MAAVPAATILTVGARRAPEPRAYADWTPQIIHPTSRPAGKAIVICCDGTSNARDQMVDGKLSPTNVFRLYQALSDETEMETRQVAWYDEGVGTGTSSSARRANVVLRIAAALVAALPKSIPDAVDKAFKMIESATGASIEENIVQGYRQIVRNYEPGDRIYIFGFSRGAYTARCIAGVIQRCGLLKHDNIRFAADAVTIYRRRRNRQQEPLLRDELIHPHATTKVHVLGLWDTVASLGLPLWGFWFRIGALWRNIGLDTDPARICEHVYHAMSVDERRSQFFPTVVTPPDDGGGPLVRQAWFRGAHADVGGGYPERQLGNVTLEWMLQIAHHHGLIVRAVEGVQFDELGIPYCKDADPLGEIHDEMQRRPGWDIFGSWPRWCPAPRPYTGAVRGRPQPTTFGAPHLSLFARAAHAAWLWRRRLAATPQDGPPLIDSRMARDGLVYLDPGDRVRVRIAANRAWNRTAVVFEELAIYRIRHVGGRWRDAEKPPCGPGGQDPAGVDLVRRLWAPFKRLPEGKWMELLGHVAHPRRWPIAEFGLRDLIRLMMWRDPLPLVRSLLPIGRHVEKPSAGSAGREVYVVNLARSGVFHAFANDCWGTYANNSGLIELGIERVVEIPPGAVFCGITARGEVLSSDRDTDAGEVLGVLHSQSRPEARPARGTWFGIPGPGDLTLGDESAPPTWRELAGLEQGRPLGLALADAALAANAGLEPAPMDIREPAKEAARPHERKPREKEVRTRARRKRWEVDEI